LKFVGSGFYAAVQGILLEHGCFLHRQGKGSHEIWYSPLTGNPFPVSVTMNTRQMANLILKQAGISPKI